ncbi:PAS domain S-box protein [Ferruginibacter sp. HRS2-29]|uniref:PAS domain S-box protein n=1 Tax=Ferruginibacter sp. HRS2-29 TaxID=2487334 RepID=UPI0020CE94DA|nr:PAS domain S-box protein [Ferruginibacter sp. HRS2-29]MCP9751801.1 PAS domain S-box protein [Ferruginibacter sp. HRS2-29]
MEKKKLVGNFIKKSISVRVICSADEKLSIINPGKILKNDFSSSGISVEEKPMLSILSLSANEKKIVLSALKANKSINFEARIKKLQNPHTVFYWEAKKNHRKNNEDTIIFTGTEINTVSGTSSFGKKNLLDGRVKEGIKDNILTNSSFIDSLHEGVVVFNKKGEIVYANKSSEAILGLPKKNIKGRTSFDQRWNPIHEDGSYFNPEDHPSVVTLHTGIPCRNVIMGVSKPSLEISWITINSQPLFLKGSSEPDQVVCTFTDITEQKKAEIDLKNSERIQRLILSSTNSAFCLLNLNYTVIMHNTTAADYYHTISGKTELKNELYINFVPLKHKKFIAKMLNNAVQGKVEEHDLLIPELGPGKYFKIIFRPVWDEKHQVIGIYNIVKDITTEKANAESLRMTRLRFQSIFNSTYQFMAILDPSGRIVELNDTFNNFTGIKREKVQGKFFWDNYCRNASEEGKETLKKNITEASGGNMIRYETEINGKTNIPALVDISIKPIYDSPGNCKFLIVEGRLIDEQRKIERELLNKELQFSSFMANTPSCAWIADEYNTLKFLNPLGLISYGLKNEAIGQPIKDIFPDEIAGQYINNNKIVLDTNKPLETTETAIDPNGETRIQHVVRFLLGTDHKGCRLIGGIAVDITQLENTKKELSILNERYQYAAKATSDAIWDWDIEKNEIFLGESSTRLFGCINLTIPMNTRVAHIHPKDRSRYIESIEVALEGNSEYWQLEYDFKDIENNYKTIFDTAYIIRDTNLKGIRMIGAMQDVTNQRKMEKKIVDDVISRKRELMKETIKAQERERKEIADELHDNVCQILATCKLYIDMCVKKDKSNHWLKDCLDLLVNALDEIRNISHKLTPAAFQEDGLCKAVKQLTSKLNDISPFKINLGIPDGERLESLLSSENKTAIYRIIQEQLNNIIKHAKATRVDINCEENHSHLCLSITDNGVGFDINTVKRGLGLNNIISRATLLGAEINFESNPGAGCKMIIIIPLK